MKSIAKGMLVLGLIMGAQLSAQTTPANTTDNSVAGLYKAVLYHKDTDYYQFADITLRTVNPGGGAFKISANVRIYFGDWNSNEFLTYEFDDCPLNLLTREISVKNSQNDVSMIGLFKNGTIQGNWYSTLQGRVGKFVAQKQTPVDVPQDGILVKTLTGHYQGLLQNNNPNSNLPERLTLTLVTTQDTSSQEQKIVVSGNTRLYVGEFGSLEYVELKLVDVQFNFYNRYLTARTDKYGITYKGYVSHDGVFKGEVFAEGVGRVGTVEMSQLP